MNPNWEYGSFRERKNPSQSEEAKIIEIKQQLWGIGPDDPLEPDQQEILKIIVASERKYDIPEEFFDMENPNFVKALEWAVMCDNDNIASWATVSKRLWGYDPRTEPWRRSRNMVKRFRKLKRATK